MIVEEISYSESRKIPTGKYQTDLISCGAKCKPSIGQDPIEASEELVAFVKLNIEKQLVKYKAFEQKN